MDCKYSTILDLWNGSTLANILELATACLCSDVDSSSNSLPEKACPSVFSSSSKMPMRLQMASAVFLLSPVIMMTLMPACLQRTMAGATSILGGSSMPTTPQKVRLTSYLANLEESSRFISVGFGGESAVARQRHLRVSRPVPYSIALAMMESLILGVMGTFSVPILTYVHLSRTPSGAPLTNILGPLPRRVGFLGEQYEDIDFRSLENSRV